jgi:hypothetical protein
MARNYNAFQTQAFNAGIPNELMLTIKDWVLQQARDYHLDDNEDREWMTPTCDLGYAELADITTLQGAFDKIKQHILMATLEDTDAKTERAKQKFYKDAGGRVGKGVYRIALKGYYLSGQ